MDQRYQSERRPRDDDDDDDDDRRPRRHRGRHDDYDDYDDRHPRSTGADPAQFLIPVGVSASSMAACYMGFVGMCVPVAGLLLTIPALIFGIIALRQDRKRAASYGKVTGNIRAVLGIVFASISILSSAIVLAVALSTQK